MDKDWSWQDEREKAVKAFGGKWPDGELEQEIIDAFRAEPARVVDEINDVGEGYKAGRIKSPWPFLRKSLSKTSEDVVVRDVSGSLKTREGAEQWMRACGLHFDRLEEIEEELFGQWGMLRHVGEAEPLRLRLLELWQEVRPEGERIEQEGNERLAKQRETVARIGRLELARKGFQGFIEPPAKDESVGRDQGWVGEEPPVRTAPAPPGPGQAR